MTVTTRQTTFHSSPSASSVGIKLQCPYCREWWVDIGTTAESDWDARQCSYCRSYIFCQDGIWRTLRQERAGRFAKFISDYEFIRSEEGRGSNASEYYLELPYRDLSGRNSSQWSIRARTYNYIERRILSELAKRSGRRLRILDLGAGNGWMSYRLALAGHDPVAVDLLTNDQDGLGAASHYRGRLPALFPRLQGELDSLPFTDGVFDVVIFNASFHYSENYEITLGEALRCTRSGGAVLIADTPWYPQEKSGQAMVSERRKHFLARYGTASDSVRSMEYLTDTTLRRLSEKFAIDWEIHTPNYGIRWALRPVIAKLRGRRTPSRFRVYLAKVTR